MSSTTRRIAAAIGTSAVLAAMLTGTAAAQSAPGPNSAACEAAKARVTELQGDLAAAQRAADEIRTEAAATNEPAVDPDTTQVDPEGDPTGPDGAADVAEGPPLDTDEPAVDPDGIGPLPAVDPDATQVDPEGDPSGLDGALDRTEGNLDTNEAPVDPDGADGISAAEQREIDRAVRVVNRVQRNLDNAEARRDKVCATPPATTNPPVAAPPRGETPTKVVWCVIRPGQCTQVEVDPDGRLIRELRTVTCERPAQLPRVTGVSKGQKVTVINHEEFVPEVYHLPSNPGPVYTPSDPGQVTRVPSGAIDTGDGTSLR